MHLFKVFDVSMPITPGMTVWKDQEAKRPSFAVTRDFTVGPNGQRTGVHEMRLCLDSHTGTHVDAPLHMLPDGRPLEVSAQSAGGSPAQWRAEPEASGQAVAESSVHAVRATAAPALRPPAGAGDSEAAGRWVGRGWVLDLTRLPFGSMIEPDAVEAALADLDVSHQTVRDAYLFFKTVNSQRGVLSPFEPQFVAVGAAAARHLVELGVRGVGIDALGIERDQPGHPTHQTLLGAGVVIIEGLRLGDVPAGEYWAVVAPLRLLDTDAAPARVLLLREGE